jgi:hypothetical protein
MSRHIEEKNNVIRKYTKVENQMAISHQENINYDKHKILFYTYSVGKLHSILASL